MITGAQRLRNEGRIAGIAEGKIEGKIEGKAGLIARLVKARWKTDICISAEIYTEPELDTLADRIVQAASLNEFTQFLKK